MTSRETNNDATFNNLVEQIRSFCNSLKDTPYFVGIEQGGGWLADSLAHACGVAGTVGKLNISFYRDDFSRIGFSPSVQPSVITESIDDKHVLLIDDVLYTGRTARSAINALFDYGRPASISLAVLVSRDGRELPIEARFVGTSMHVGHRMHIKVSGPHPLLLEQIPSVL